MEYSKPLCESFSTVGWMRFLVDLIRNANKIEVKALVLALQCLRSMSIVTVAMRFWGLLEVVPLLCSLVKRTTVQSVKSEAQGVLRNVCIYFPELGKALVDLRTPNVDVLDSCSLHVDLNAVLVELLSSAEDLAIGSTLQEQSKFTSRFNDWLQRAFGSSNEALSMNKFPAFRDLCRRVGTDIVWSTIIKISKSMCTWLSRLCFSIELQVDVTSLSKTSADAARKSRKSESIRLASALLTSLESIVLRALLLDGPTDSGPFLDLFWYKSERAWRRSGQNHSGEVEDINSENSYGLLECLSQLTATGYRIVESDASLRLALQLVRTLERTIRLASPAFIESLCGLGLFNTVDKFLRAALQVARDASVHKIGSVYRTTHVALVRGARGVWQSILQRMSTNLKNDIVSSGILQQLVEVWLEENTVISFSPVIDNSRNVPDFSPYVIRSEAVHMLQILYGCSVEAKINQNNSELFEEIWLTAIDSFVASNAVKRELDRFLERGRESLPTLVVAEKSKALNPQDKASAHRFTSEHSSLALTVIHLIALLNDDSLNNKFYVSYHLTELLDRNSISLGERGSERVVENQSLLCYSSGKRCPILFKLCGFDSSCFFY